MLRGVLEVLAQALHDEGYLDLQETFIDGSFAPAKQGGAGVGKTKRWKGSKIMAIADRRGLPRGSHRECHAARSHPGPRNPRAAVCQAVPCALIGDNACQSDRLMLSWPARGVELIAPHRDSPRSGTPPVSTSVSRLRINSSASRARSSARRRRIAASISAEDIGSV